MGPIWDRQDPGGPHVDPMNFAIWESHYYVKATSRRSFDVKMIFLLRPVPDGMQKEYTSGARNSIKICPISIYLNFKSFKLLAVHKISFSDLIILKIGKSLRHTPMLSENF